MLLDFAGLAAAGLLGEDILEEVLQVGLDHHIIGKSILNFLRYH